MGAEAVAHDEEPMRLVSHLMDERQEPRTPYISSGRFAKHSGVDTTRITLMMGVHRNTLRNDPGSEQVQMRMREMTRVIVAALALKSTLEKRRCRPVLYRGSMERGFRLILSGFATERIFYRYLTPRWSHLPLIGADAAPNGERFDRPGIEALP